MSVTPSGEIVEGSSVNLTCSSDANPAATYTWYKGNEYEKPESLSFSTIQSSDSGEYTCVAENELGKTATTYTIDVKREWKTVDWL